MWTKYKEYRYFLKTKQLSMQIHAKDLKIIDFPAKGYPFRRSILTKAVFLKFKTTINFI